MKERWMKKGKVRYKRMKSVRTGKRKRRKGSREFLISLQPRKGEMKRLEGKVKEEGEEEKKGREGRKIARVEKEGCSWKG